MRIASKVQYNKREINLGNITSCQDFVPFGIFDISILYLLSIFYFSFVFIFKSVMVPFTHPGLILNMKVLLHELTHA